MSEYGVDLAEWYAAGRWVGLLELIYMLPSACRLNDAIAQDEDAAEYILSLPEHEGNGEPEGPPVSEFTLTNSLLTQVVNELKSLRLSGQYIAGAKPKREDPISGPRTAVDRVRERLEIDGARQVAVGFGFDSDDFG